MTSKTIASPFLLEDGVFENDYAADEDADETDDEDIFSELNVPFDSDLEDSDEE